MASFIKPTLTAEEFAAVGYEVPTPEKPRQRKKVPLGKGFSPLDWAKLSRERSSASSGVPLIKVTMEELQRHDQADDCWVALHGKVYDLTAYLRFHPGGDAILLRLAGRDVTRHFQYFHDFVNYQRLLESCLIGALSD